MKKRWSYLKQSLKNMRTTATVTKSSRYTCRAMIKHVDFENADVIVEIGAGDGVITKHILAEMKPGTKLLCFEILDHFCEILHEIEDDRLVIIQDSAEHIGKYLQKHGFEKADAIVSAVPFVMLPRELSIAIVTQLKKYIRPNGIMVQLHYSTIVKKIYQNIFGNVKTEFVARNIPPAILHIMKG
ncbi:MAG: class I SAM-dependent methyltransferase [Saprospiraceae bacterium]